MSVIKCNKANKIWSTLPMAEREIWGSIPLALVDKLTSQELALVKQALNNHWHKAQKAAIDNVLTEGCIWDDNNQKLIEFD